MANHYATNRKEVVSFRKSIPAATTDILAERIKAPGTIEEIRVRFYTGQQLALEVNPFVEHKGQKIEQLITYAETGKAALSGDDDYFVLPVVVSVDYDDFIKIQARNTDPTYAYTLSVDVVIDYYGGKNRVIGGVI